MGMEEYVKKAELRKAMEEDKKITEAIESIIVEKQNLLEQAKSTKEKLKIIDAALKLDPEVFKYYMVSKDYGAEMGFDFEEFERMCLKEN